MNVAVASGSTRRGTAASLDHAMWRSASIGIVVWNLAVGMLVFWCTPESRTVVLTMQFSFIVVAAATAGGRYPAQRALFFLALSANLTAELAMVSDPLTTTVVCLTFMLIATTFLVLRWELAAFVAGTSLVAAAAFSVESGLGGRVVLALAFPATCYSLAAWTIMTVLRRFTSMVDEADFAAEAAHSRLLEAQASTRTASEYARTLHDTVINTLAAIAVGGSAVADAEQVGNRCAQDLDAIGALEAGKRQDQDALELVGDELSLAVNWTGLTGAALQREFIRLNPERQNALRGILKATLLNVEGHANTHEAFVHATVAGEALKIVVTDHGIGYDPEPTGEDSRVQSVMLRAAENDIKISISSEKGAGTSVRIECPHDTPAIEQLDGPDWTERASELRRTATWLWAAVVGSASLAITAVGTSTPASNASAVLVLVISLGACWHRKGGSELPTAGVVVVVIAVPVAFILGLIGANFGEGDEAFWPAIGLTPLLVVLLTLTPHRWPLIVASGSLVLAAVASAGVLWNGRPDAAGAAIANVTIELIQLMIWMLFLNALNVVVVRSTQSSQQRLRENAHRAGLNAARQTREYWRDAQLEIALDLMLDIVKKQKLPEDPSTRRLAGNEEHALRQLLMLNPDQVHLSPVLARTIARGRQREIKITIRTGSRDLKSPAIALSVGTALEKVIDNVKAGTEITVAYFGDHLTVVVPSGLCDQAIPADAHVRHLPAQDLIMLHTAAN